ncbi:MAG: MBL fold metallo-hydrolase [Spirochaetes bacterium]|nr:MBL fold metallo-hydrolase [Spirochaetota bacterium]
MFKVKFWGVRGSIACPGPQTARYGGNTSCLQIITDQDYAIVLDFGTGARILGGALLGDPNLVKPLKIHAFLTHTHWDHIMGFPFFAPIHVPGSDIDIYGPVSIEENLETIVGGQLTYKYFPVRIDELRSTINYHHLKEGSMELPGGMKVSYKYLNHPILCLGYKFEYQGKIIATCYDHEPFQNLFANDPDNFAEGEIAAEEQNKLIRDFYKNVDVLIHDAQYTSEEYKKFMGWGHSTYKYAINQALKSKAKKLILFHHDPGRQDDQLDVISKVAAEKLKDQPIEIIPAMEGMEISL